MKILVINWQDIKNPFGGGAETHLHEIFKRIAAHGNHVELFSCEIEGEPSEETIDGIKIFRKGKRDTFNFGVKKIYRQRFMNAGFDIVIDDINKIPFYTSRFVKQPVLAIGHHLFGKSIFKEVGKLSGTYVYLAEKLIPQYYRNTPLVVVSESTKQEFVQLGFDEKKIDIVYNAIDPSEFPMKVLNKSNHPVVTYFGRLKKYKSIDHLIKAFAIVREQIPESDLWIIGRGDYQSSLESLASKLNLKSNIVFHGFVEEEKKKELLSSSYLVVNTSLKEGWGITNIESNACGTPVVSANVPGLRDSVKDGESGLLYEYGNINELAEKIITVLSNDTKRKELEQGAIQWASKFNWDDSAKKMYGIMERVVNTANSGSPTQ